MIFLHKPYIKSHNGKSRLCFDVDINEQKKKIWYEVNQEYQNFDDIEDEEEMIAYITEMLDEAYGEDEQYNPLVAGILYHMVKDDVIEEIHIRDENAREYDEERMEIH